MSLRAHSSDSHNFLSVKLQYGPNARLLVVSHVIFLVCFWWLVMLFS
jgi:hypothetical protein